MRPVAQEEATGCAIACAAALSGITYQEAKRIAKGIGIYAQDTALWSETDHIRRLLNVLGIEAGGEEIPFPGWDKLPDCALLSIKWHEVAGKPYWHWVVFVRDGEMSFVLDSRKALKNHLRTDYRRMKPKWYIELFA